MAQKRKIVASTSVAEAAKADPGTIARMAKLHPALARLETPGIGRVLARLVTFEDIARIAGVDLDGLLAAANGAEDVPIAGVPHIPETVPGWVPDWSEAAKALHPYLDVRPIIAGGGDPFAEVMALADKAPDGGLILIEAPFNPAPLRRVMGERGFSSHASMAGAGHWRISFVRDGAGDGAAVPVRAIGGCGAAKTARIWRDGVIDHIDVRGMSPPGPLVAILRLVEGAAPGATIRAHHDREPFFLYPELEARGWKWRRIEAPDGEYIFELTAGR